MSTPKTHFTGPEHHACNLGARMAADGYELKDNPYTTPDILHLSHAWQTGHGWQHVLKTFKHRTTEGSNTLRAIA